MSGLPPGPPLRLLESAARHESRAHAALDAAQSAPSPVERSRLQLKGALELDRARRGANLYGTHRLHLSSRDYNEQTRRRVKVAAVAASESPDAKVRERALMLLATTCVGLGEMQQAKDAFSQLPENVQKRWFGEPRRVRWSLKTGIAI